MFSQNQKVIHKKFGCGSVVTDMGDCTDAMTAFFDSFEAAK